jgi:hypothetical protein
MYTMVSFPGSGIGQPLTVFCSITAGAGCGDSLDHCKKHLERSGDSRSKQDGLWTDMSDTGKGGITVMAFNTSRSNETQ